jgi:cyclo(L-tyrosyl-L-tyrosyl) synthase
MNMSENKLLIIGMSPGNGYFKQEVVNRLLTYCVSNFNQVEVLIPDIPATSTYVALGYPENKARSKAILQGNNFRNRINSTISNKNLDSNKIRVLNWEKDNIENNQLYREAFDHVQNLYERNLDFQKDINLATEKVLINNQFKKKEINQEDIVVGTHYIISEFAFNLFISNSVQGYDNFVYGYHRPWPVWEKFIAGEYDGKKKDNLGFLLLPDFSKSA